MVSYTESFDFLQEMYMRDLNLRFLNNNVFSGQAQGDFFFPSVVDVGSTVRCAKKDSKSLFLTELNLDAVFIFAPTFLRGAVSETSLISDGSFSVRVGLKGLQVNSLNYVAASPAYVRESCDYIYDYYSSAASLDILESPYNFKINSLIIHQLSCLVSRFDVLFKKLLLEDGFSIDLFRVNRSIQFNSNSVFGKLVDIKHKFYSICWKKDRLKTL